MGQSLKLILLMKTISALLLITKTKWAGRKNNKNVRAQAIFTDVHDFSKTEK